MYKLLIYFFIIILTCSCNDEKTIPAINRTKFVALKMPKFYFGDKLLTYSFKIKSDTAYVRESMINHYNLVKIKTEIKKDTTYIYLYKIMVLHDYNGACEYKNDTLNLNIWIDSICCYAAEVHYKLTYKIKQIKNINPKKIKVNFIKTNSPRIKDCE